MKARIKIVFLSKVTQLNLIYLFSAGTMHYLDGVAIDVTNSWFLNSKSNACDTLHRNGHGCLRCLKGGRGHGKSKSQAKMWKPKSCPSKHKNPSIKNCLLRYC